jgi:hypothetical protein
MTLRPNQIFTAPLLDEHTRATMLRTVVSKLTYPYGVASLAQDEAGFHPYHQNPRFYPKDAAYHNGTVWTWLQGPVISELSRVGEQNLAWLITANSVRQILDRGAVGTQSELLDALPRPGKGEPEPSGTFSQAWNLAEFVRNFYDDYLGLRVSLLDHAFRMQPNIPDSLGNVNAALTLAGGRVTVRHAVDHGVTTLGIRTERSGKPWNATVCLRISGGRKISISYRQPADGEVTLSLRGDSLAWKGCPEPPERRIDPAPVLPGSLRLATPHLAEDLPALRGPRYLLLPNGAIKRYSPGARLLVDAVDPEGDDSGIFAGSRYTYPLNPVFVPGSFDIVAFRVQYDSADVFFHLKFHGLSDPGWHPEYGFQLTFAAIAIDTDGIPGSGATAVPQNAAVTLPAEHPYERLILVGGGLRVEDAGGNILAAYLPLPEDELNPLGDAGGGSIDFALPRSVLGSPGPQWHFTVLSGAQDDHGGAGLGEFRTVLRTAGEWNGGGKLRPEDPNVFDILEAAPK